MQLNYDNIRVTEVVFTLQTAGRCNPLYMHLNEYKLFLPCKQQADATLLGGVGDLFVLFLPCKQQADAT